MQDVFYPSADGVTTVHACVWKSEGEPKAILQIIHGMAEYAERYAPFAEYLADKGFTVCAEDHLGHGKSMSDESKAGYFTKGNGFPAVLKDIRSLTEIMREKYPGVPYFILGHSMGSFFARRYIASYGAELSGAVIMGTGFQSGLTTGAAKLLTSLSALFGGWKKKSNFIENLAFGSYNKRFEKRTEKDWLSVNTQNVDAYIADENCGVQFTLSGYMGLFTAVAEACKGKTIKSTPKDLPILIVSGKDDPVGAYSKGVIKLYDKYIKAGVKSVEMTLYENSRHEILNDNCAPQVREDILAFLEGGLNGNKK